MCISLGQVPRDLQFSFYSSVFLYDLQISYLKLTEMKTFMLVKSLSKNKNGSILNTAKIKTYFEAPSDIRVQK